jgi:hypothetical protein
MSVSQWHYTALYPRRLQSPFYVIYPLFYTESWAYSIIYVLVCMYIGCDGVGLTSQNCSLYRPIVHPWMIAMWIMVWWYRLGLTPNLSIRVLWQPPVLSGSPVSRDICGANRRVGEGNENLVNLSLWDFKRSLTFCILWDIFNVLIIKTWHCLRFW